MQWNLARDLSTDLPLELNRTCSVHVHACTQARDDKITDYFCLTLLLAPLGIKELWTTLPFFHYMFGTPPQHYGFMHACTQWILFTFRYLLQIVGFGSLGKFPVLTEQKYSACSRHHIAVKCIYLILQILRYLTDLVDCLKLYKVCIPPE